MKQYEHTKQYEFISVALTEAVKSHPKLCESVDKVKFIESSKWSYLVELNKDGKTITQYGFSMSIYQDCCGIKIISDLHCNRIDRYNTDSNIKAIAIIAILSLLRIFKASQVTFAHNNLQSKAEDLIKHIFNKFYITPIKPLVSYNSNSANYISSYIVPVRPFSVQENDQIFKPEIVEEFSKFDNGISESYDWALTLDDWKHFEQQSLAVYTRQVTNNKLITEYYINLINAYLKFLI